uniref:Uncharacterized protein n=1 Tax=Cacopsylla melanoneura TaxID=428564 RepID=A0A8D8Q5L8_9HEMI
MKYLFIKNKLNKIQRINFFLLLHRSIFSCFSIRALIFIFLQFKKVFTSSFNMLLDNVCGHWALILDTYVNMDTGTCLLFSFNDCGDWANCRADKKRCLSFEFQSL